MLVDAFPRTTDELAERALRYFDADRAGRRSAVLFGEPDQDFGNPRFKVTEGEILDLLVGAPEALAQHDEEVEAKIRPALEQGQERAAGHNQQLAIAHRGR